MSFFDGPPRVGALITQLHNSSHLCVPGDTANQFNQFNQYLQGFPFMEIIKGLQDAEL